MLCAASASGSQIELPGLPGFPIFREAIRVGCGLEGFLCEDACSLMMPVPIRSRTAECRDDDLRSELSNNTDEIPKHLFMAPFFESFVRALGKTKLVDRRKELLRVICTAGGKQLLSADHAERLEELGAKKILASVASRGRQVGGPNALSPRQPG